MGFRISMSLPVSEVKILEKKLKTIGETLDRKTRLRILKTPVKNILVKAAARRAPKAKKVLIRKNWKGKETARYSPGNLKRSLKALQFRKSWNAFAGPRYFRARRGKNGQFKENPASRGNFNSNTKVDGWYAHFLNFGTRKGIKKSLFMWRAAKAVGAKLKNEIIRRTDARIKRVIKKKKL